MRKRSLWKKSAAILLAAVMTTGLAACGGQSEQTAASSEEVSVSEESQSAEAKQQEDNGQATEDSGEPVEISIAVWNADAAFAGDDVLSQIEEKLNIKITPVNVTWDDYLQKIPLWASSGSLPDVFIGDFRNSVSYPQWADQGVIKAIPEDLSAYPNLEEYLSGQTD